MRKERGFTLIENGLILALVIGAGTLALAGFKQQREAREQERLVQRGVEVFNQLAIGVESYIAGNPSSFSAGAMVSVSVGDLVAGNHISSDLLDVSPYSPLGGQLIINAQRDATDSDVIRAVITDGGAAVSATETESARAPIMVRANLSDASTSNDKGLILGALVSSMGHKVHELHEKVMGVVPSCLDSIAVSSQPVLQLDLDGWLGEPSCERPRPVVFLGWPELGQSGVDCEVESCIGLDFEMPDAEECYIARRNYSYGFISGTTNGPWIYNGSDSCGSGYTQVANFPTCGVQITPASEAGTSLTQGERTETRLSAWFFAPDPDRAFYTRACQNPSACTARRNERTYGQVSVNNSLVDQVLCDAREYVTDTTTSSPYVMRGYVTGNTSLCCR